MTDTGHSAISGLNKEEEVMEPIKNSATRPEKIHLIAGQPDRSDKQPVDLILMKNFRAMLLRSCETNATCIVPVALPEKKKCWGRK